MNTPTQGHALITGASRGIGRSLAHQLAQKGYPLLLTATNTEKLEAVAAEVRQSYQAQAETFQADLSSDAGCQALISHCQAKGHTVEVLVNNAGFGDYGPFLEREWAKYDQMIQVNIRALTHLSHHFLQGMKTRGKGYLLNVSSVAGFQPGPFFAVYCASKAYVSSFTEALSQEVKPHGIRVLNLCPGYTTTDFAQRAEVNNPNLIDDNRGASPEEVAAQGIEALFAGKEMHVVGLVNRGIATVVGFLPRKFLRSYLAKKMQPPPTSP